MLGCGARRRGGFCLDCQGDLRDDSLSAPRPERPCPSARQRSPRTEFIFSPEHAGCQQPPSATARAPGMLVNREGVLWLEIALLMLSYPTADGGLYTLVHPCDADHLG